MIKRLLTDEDYRQKVYQTSSEIFMLYLGICWAYALVRDDYFGVIYFTLLGLVTYFSWRRGNGSSST